MLNLFQCRDTAPFWRACIDFTISICGAPRPNDYTKAIIFGMWGLELGPESARAFLRHAFGFFYKDFSDVDLKEGKSFYWETVCLRKRFTPSETPR